MADDLKTILDKVKKSQGKKRYPFAYGTGKRSDGKGDGALVVAVAKIKKAELEKECPCAQYFEGFCWGAPDGSGTIYFGGKKKLDATLIAKMVLTVNKTMGRLYVFAIPSAEEEARAEALGDSEAGEGEGEGEEAGVDPAKELYEGLRSTVLPDLARLLKTDAATGAKIRQIVESAAGLAKSGDYRKAATYLDKASTALAGAASAARTAEVKATAPTGKVGLEVLRVELRTLRVGAIGGIAKLATKLGATPHPQASQVAQIVKQLAKEMPAELENHLQELDKAVQAKDTAAVTRSRAAVKKSASDWLTFLQTNKDYIHGCETNPWDIPLQIEKPVRASLAAILKTAM